MIYLLIKRKKEIIFVIFLLIFFYFSKGFFYNIYSYIILGQVETKSQRILKEQFNESSLPLDLAENLMAENKELSSFLNYSKNREYFLAYILANKKNLLKDEIIIDIGSNLNLSLNAKVYDAEKNLIGHIAEIKKYVSRVELLSAAGISNLAFINNHSYLLKSVGDGNFLIELDYEIAPEEIKIGDFAFIGNERAAAVFAIDINVSDSTTFIYLASLKNIYTLKRVYVEKK